MDELWIPPHREDAKSRQPAASETSWGEIGRIWLRASWVIIPLAFLGAIIAVAITFTMPSVYDAESVILLDRPNTGRLENAAVGVSLDAIQRASVVKSQIEILRGNEVVGAVISKLHLDAQPMFNPKPSLTAQALASLTALIGISPAASPAGAALTPEERLRPAFLEHLVLRQDPDTYILHVGFRAPDPAIAAAAANTEVASYIAWSHDRQSQAIDGTQAWLQSAVASAHDRVIASEQAVQDFSKTGVLTDVSGRTALDEGLTKLTTELASAQAELVRAQARSTEIQNLQKAGQHAGIAAMSGSRVLEELESAYAQSVGNAAGQQSNYGARYPSVVQGQAHDTEIKAAIAREIDHFVQGEVSQANIARATVNNLTAALEQMKQQVIGSASDRAKLIRLDGEAKAERDVYLSLLQKLRSYDNVGALAQPDVTVLAPAATPGAPSSPKRGLFAAFGFLLAGSMAAGASVWRVVRRDVIRHTSDVIDLTGVRCLGVMPEMRMHGRNGIDRRHASYSFFRQEMRSICASLVQDRMDRARTQGERPTDGISVVITSPLPGEGKSTFSYELSRFAAEGGIRTLIVRTDAAPGLVPIDRSGAIIKQLDDQIPLFATDWGAPATMINEHSITRALTSWRHEFGLVVFDTPPVSAMAESIILAPLVDAMIVLARVDHTPRALLANVANRIDKAGGRLAGMVLTFVQLDSQRGMVPSDAGYYYRHNRAYHRRLAGPQPTADAL